MSINKRETSLPQPSIKEWIWGSIYKANMAANSKKQARQFSHETGQCFMVSSMFFEPIIPRWGHSRCACWIQTCDNKIFFSQESYILLPKLEKVSTTSAPPPHPRQQENKTLTCLQQLSGKFLPSTDWMRTGPLTNAITFIKNGCGPPALKFPAPLPSSLHLPSAKGFAQVWSKTFPFQRQTQSRKKEGREEPF